MLPFSKNKMTEEQTNQIITQNKANKHFWFPIRIKPPKNKNTKNIKKNLKRTNQR
jgi:hypothetical protein